ncbi:MAG TPA: uroporphyrinogen decarboxylase family protein [Methanospirillum sp.]|uniref:uroporphyrinogen decarboxylase family protein n=1 Tax=Methanospirillum sp. TaxID=45200 RepID=UPI002D0E2AAC|nr:uroporphyrinogen decarboxylase family protein [Methanospirillum sp.]HWQ64797.1 uroporphyrinogen decarboxylase family protein [Methanospirillum sp.]
MNQLERVIAAVSFQPTDRPPVIPQVFAHTAVLNGAHIIDYVRSGDLAAIYQLQALHFYRYDAVFGVLDLCIEPEVIGATIRFPQDNYPSVSHPPFTTDAAFDHLTLPDMKTSGRVPHVLTAIRTLRKDLNDMVPVIGLVQGPMTLALHLLGTENALYLAADDPERFEQLLTYTTRIAHQYGIAQLNAGAHIIMIFEPGASPEVIPPSFFSQCIAPRLTQLFASFKQSGSYANWLHIAGNVGSILNQYDNIGVNIANFDYCVSPQKACQELAQVCLNGNISSVSFIADTPEMIIKKSLELLKTFAERRGFILSSGCEIPPESPPANIAAMVHSSVQFSQGKGDDVKCQ